MLKELQEAQPGTDFQGEMTGRVFVEQLNQGCISLLLPAIRTVVIYLSSKAPELL
jgi:hypothetical protein